VRGRSSSRLALGRPDGTARCIPHPPTRKRQQLASGALEALDQLGDLDHADLTAVNAREDLTASTRRPLAFAPRASFGWIEDSLRSPCRHDERQRANSKQLRPFGERRAW